MIRPIHAVLMGTLVLAGPAWAAEANAEVGRYLMIPDAVLPGKGGKAQKRAVLLDTVTGRTWLIAPGAQRDKAAGPVWVPLEIEIGDRANTATRSDSGARGAAVRKPKAASPPAPRRGSSILHDYDDDP